jgi:hypothetical protein
VKLGLQGTAGKTHPHQNEATKHGVNFFDDLLQNSVHHAEFMPKDSGIPFQPDLAVDKDLDSVKVSPQTLAPSPSYC